MDKKQHCDQQY